MIVVVSLGRCAMVYDGFGVTTGFEFVLLALVVVFGWW